jgi:outer membrane protein assembly factor BamB
MASGKYTPFKTPVSRLVFLWLAGLVLAGCDERKTAPAVAGSHHWQTTAWAATRGGHALQGRVNDRVPRDPAVEWSFMAKAPITSEAAVARGVIVFGDGDGIVHALDSQTGKERWRVETKDAVDATPAIVSDRVFVGSNDGMFRALDLATGREVWHIEGEDKFPTGGVPFTSPDSSESWILVNGYDGVLRCLRTTDGSRVWTLETQDYINGSPAILDGGLVVFGGCDSLVHVVRLNDGTPVRKVTTDAQIIRSMAGFGESVYGVNYANQLLAANANEDALSWRYENDGNQFLTSPGVDDVRVYAGSRDKHLHAVDRKSGEPVWKFRTGGRVESSPLVFDDAVVFGSNDGRLYAVNKTDGCEIWRLDLGEGLANAPAFADGRIVIGGHDGTLFVIRGGTGE